MKRRQQRQAMRRQAMRRQAARLRKGKPRHRVVCAALTTGKPSWQRYDLAA